MEIRANEKIRKGVWRELVLVLLALQRPVDAQLSSGVCLTKTPCKRGREQRPSGGSLGSFSRGAFLGVLTVGGARGEKQAVEECPCGDTENLPSGQGLTSRLSSLIHVAGVETNLPSLRALPLSIAPTARRAGRCATMESLSRSCLWLRQELSSPRPQLLLLDCRSRELYESARICGALSVALPSLMLRRLRRGSMSVRSLLPGPPLQPPPPAPVLLYDQGSSGQCHREAAEAEAKAEAKAEAEAEAKAEAEDKAEAKVEAKAEAEEWDADSVLGILLQKLREEGFPAYYLQGK